MNVKKHPHVAVHKISWFLSPIRALWMNKRNLNEFDRAIIEFRICYICDF